MPRRLLVAGPKNSSKSGYVLSAIQYLQSHGRTARAIELDVWSSSYPAFEGKIPFEGRPKRFDAAWPWKDAADPRIADFNTATDDVIFGDLPGKIDPETTAYLVRQSRPDGAIVISSTVDGIKEWRAWIESLGVRVLYECLSFQGQKPLVLRDLRRTIQPGHPDVADLAALALGGIDFDAARRSTLSDARFRHVFLQNVARRSRTIHGVDIPSGSVKRRLMLTGDALKMRAIENTGRLADDILATPRPPAWEPAVFRSHCERWFDIANEGIHDPDWYEEDLKGFASDAALVARARGGKPRLNPRYRLWTPDHTLVKVPPILLEEEMDRYYARLAELVARAEERFPSWNDVLETMAYADLMMEGELRPWLDGCTRVSIALSMWIARTLGVPIPLYAGSKEAHAMTIRDLDRHRTSILESIRRAEAEAP